MFRRIRITEINIPTCTSLSCNLLRGRKSGSCLDGKKTRLPSGVQGVNLISELRRPAGRDIWMQICIKNLRKIALASQMRFRVIGTLECRQINVNPKTVTVEYGVHFPPFSSWRWLFEIILHLRPTYRPYLFLSHYLKLGRTSCGIKFDFKH